MLTLSDCRNHCKFFERSITTKVLMMLQGLSQSFQPSTYTYTMHYNCKLSERLIKAKILIIV